MNNKADVVIVGGGIIGCATAYYLAKKNISVIVLEGSDYIGNGGSSRNGGGVRQSGRDPRELPVVMWGIKNLWPTLSEELGVDVEYTQNGNLRLGKTEKHLQILTELTNKAKACGLDVKMIDSNEVKKINPHLSEEVIGASWCPTDGHANTLTATLGYYKKARELGVRFITGEKVIKLKTIKGKLRQVITENNVYEGDKVLVASGFESREITKTVGIDVPIHKLKMECLVTEIQPPMFKQMLGTAEADFYGHQTKHGSFVFGGSTGFEGFEVDGDTLISNSIGASCTCRGIMKYFPELSNAKIVRTWTGWIDECADKIPVMSKVDEVEGLYLACGFTGHGFGIAPGAAYNLAELIADGKTTVDLSEFRYDRFKSKI
ncbi:MAG TPA: FAD-dependent oxidoreductase [Lachnospiraceae bacterium]|nr:FAD-dependent oxidoreductase [Lachnospiraceae bacterium]